MTWWRKLFFVTGLVILTVGGVCNLQGVFGPKVDVGALVLSAGCVYVISVLYWSMEKRGFENLDYHRMSLRETGILVFLMLIPIVLALLTTWWLLLIAWIGTVLGFLASFPPSKPKRSV
ncbi:hypothetical protein A3C17_03790 [Candidatus Uhrbacteria bacterium RIFCSPHIGHO2_02_FULL_53_13]|uniref:Uncharacterized protein n=2 Tax=Candidatus Uhriibacteriota TaxID=1752732 RepID=A0A1F7U0E7_9BACT|nr:MAG: hypothetical protein A3C17_03790 [Candidatus Uhrbacteria bacterium RIFCSPHIGHO2_02_FULL_53_13]OGL89984.1 MAG: hypothetical protein A3I45_02540 [Candidatus Uhrbacteria bacterium RIFCSPLOWO2_02_FULL_53_10]